MRARWRSNNAGAMNDERYRPGAARTCASRWRHKDALLGWAGRDLDLRVSRISYDLRRAEQEAIRAIASDGSASEAHAELSRLYSNRALRALGRLSGRALAIIHPVSPMVHPVTT